MHLNQPLGLRAHSDRLAKRFIGSKSRKFVFEISIESLSDNELAARAASGSADHFTALVRRYSSAMYRLAYRLIGNESEAEDVAQETFIKLFLALPKADLDPPFKPWLYKIAVNACFSHIRKKKGKHWTGLETADAAARFSDISETVNDRIDAQKALAGLPLNYRQIVVLRAVEELTFAEISEILDIPEPTARTRFKRAKDSLRQQLIK